MKRPALILALLVCMGTRVSAGEDFLFQNGFEPFFLAQIVVTPVDPFLIAGLELQLTATCIWSDDSEFDCTSVVTWESSDTNIAVVLNVPPSEGLAVGISEGVATITASTPEFVDVEGSILLTVTPPELADITVLPSPGEIPEGCFLQMTATGSYTDGSNQDITESVVWISENDAVATVENSPQQAGRVLGQNAAAVPNPVEITAFDVGTGLNDSALITVTNDKLCPE